MYFGRIYGGMLATWLVCSSTLKTEAVWSSETLVYF
jgi:hypothetical protein